MPAPACTQTAQLALDGHAANLAERGEAALGHPLPVITGVRVDAVLSVVTAADQLINGGVYAKGDFRLSVAKVPFREAPAKGDACQIRGERWKVNDPVSERLAVYDLAITKQLRS